MRLFRRKPPARHWTRPEIDALLAAELPTGLSRRYFDILLSLDPSQTTLDAIGRVLAEQS